MRESRPGLWHWYELDGGDRTEVKAFKVKVEASAITVCVPESES